MTAESPRALEIADRVEAFVRDVVVPYEGDPRRCRPMASAAA
jgi:hypothetical protein